jgi:hypothetical protein
MLRAQTCCGGISRREQGPGFPLLLLHASRWTVMTSARSSRT